jgi:HEPN domain-containing protein
MEFLKKKAKYFEDEAREAYEKSRHTMVLFFLEQAIQLYLRYLIYKRIGDYPKIHNLRILFENLNKLVDISKFVSENEEIIDLLTTSYIEAKYAMMEYSKKSAEISLKFLEKFKEKFKNEID